MKKLLALVLTACMLLCLASCGAEKVQRGTIDGNVYKSEFSGITFTKPDSWVFASDEEIAETMNIGADMLDKNNFEKAVAEAATTFDMMVTDPATNSNVNISYENLEVTNNEDKTLEEYIDVALEQFKAQDIIEYEIGETEKVTLCGETYSRIITTASYNGVEMTQVYYMRKIDNIIVNVIVTAVNTELSEIESMFS